MRLVSVLHNFASSFNLLGLNEERIMTKRRQDADRAPTLAFGKCRVKKADIFLRLITRPPRTYLSP